MKCIKSISVLLLCVFLCSALSSCHNPPTWFWDTEEFDLTEEKLDDICKAVEDIDCSDYYISRHTDTGTLISEEVCVLDESVVVYLSEMGENRVIRDGYMYTINDYSETHKEAVDFATAEYSQIVDNSYAVLKTICESEIDSFWEVSAISTIFEDAISVTLEYKEEARIEFKYNPDNNTYSEFQLAWHDEMYSYLVWFDINDYPESMMSSVETVINSVENN